MGQCNRLSFSPKLCLDVLSPNLPLISLLLTLICHLSYYLLVFFKVLQLRKKSILNSISLGQKLSLVKRKDCKDQNKWKSIQGRH